MNLNKNNQKDETTTQQNNKNIIRTDNLYLRKILLEEKKLTYEDKKVITKLSKGKQIIPVVEETIISYKLNNEYKSKLRNKNK